MTLSIKSLISKLDKCTTKALENSVKLCSSKKMPSVEIEHLIVSFLQDKQSDFFKILDDSELDLIELLNALQISFTSLEGKLTTQTPSLSKTLITLIQNTWMVASVEYQMSQISSGYILLAILKHKEELEFNYQLKSILQEIDLSKVLDYLKSVTKEASTMQAQKIASSDSALEKFSTDLVVQAKQGKLDRAIGRTNAIAQVVDVLCRRKQNNPIVVGEAGVGKTCIVEELAINIAEKNVPESLHNATIKVLDLAALSAGASVKGEFEERLKQIVTEVKTSPTQIILFIDEIHNMLGSGSGVSGQNDAANILKPELAKGDLKVIGATTWAEYKKFFEKDAALNRRFQLIKINEPSEQEAVSIVTNVASLLEKHHNVKVLDEAVEYAVKLSIRYITHLRLPDKAITLLDSACSKVRLMQNSIPESIAKMKEDIRLTKLDIERCQKNFMEEESEKKIQDLQEKLLQLEKDYEVQEEMWQKKLAISTSMKEMKAEQKEEYLQKQEELKQLDDKNSVLYPYVNKEVIADILTSWTNIPISTTTSEEEVASLLSLEERIKERVIGQDHAVDKIVQTIRISKANMGDERKPIGVFFLVGESGIGKTEMALSIAETIYGHEDKIITINMSEYKESHKVASLIGSPPGYVGYGEGGRLTEAVRKSPYSVILLDEIEKAHPDVQDLFLQVFDKGMLQDSEGVLVDFKNTVIIMTSNAGAKIVSEFCRKKLNLIDKNDNTQKNPDIDDEKIESKIADDLNNQALQEESLKNKDETDDVTDLEEIREDDLNANDTKDKNENSETENEDCLDSSAKEIIEEDKEKIQKEEEEEEESKEKEMHSLQYLREDEIALLKDAISKELLNYFKPEFLGRVSTIPFVSLSSEILKFIVKIQMEKISKKLKNFYNAEFVYEDSVIDVIASQANESAIGARKIEQIVQADIMPDLSLALLDLQAQKRYFRQILLKYQYNTFFMEVKGVRNKK